MNSAINASNILQRLGSGGVVFPVDFTGITEASFFGDSIMEGANATGSDFLNSFRRRLTIVFGWNPTELAQGGTGTWDMAKALNAISPSQANRVLFVQGGLNDIRTSNGIRTFNKIESGLYSILKRAFRGTSVAAGSSSVTRSGSFTAFSALQYGGVYGAGTGSLPSTAACINSTDNATWTYTFNGNNIAVEFSASEPTIARGTAEIRIDGVLVDTLTDLNQRYDGVTVFTNDNRRGPHTWVRFGLTEGQHTIEVKALSGALPVFLDEFNILSDPEDCGPVFVIEVPRIVNYAAAGKDQASDSLIDQVNALRKTVVTRWRNARYPVYFIPINLVSGGLYNVTTGCDTDGIHPNDVGHDQIRDTIEPLIAYP